MEISDIASQAMSMNAAKLQQSAGIAVMKQQQKMDASLINMIDKAIASAPLPPGVGGNVDKLA
jgi:hypothetical protein